MPKTNLNIAQILTPGKIQWYPSGSNYQPTSSAPATAAQFDIQVNSVVSGDWISNSVLNPYIIIPIMSSSYTGTNYDLELVIRFFTSSHFLNYHTGSNFIDGGGVNVLPISSSLYYTGSISSIHRDILLSPATTGEEHSILIRNTIHDAIVGSSIYNSGMISASKQGNLTSSIFLTNVRGKVNLPTSFTGSIATGRGVNINTISTGSGTINFFEQYVLSENSASLSIEFDENDPTSLILKSPTSSLNSGRSNSTLMYFSSSGHVGIGTKTPKADLEVTGSIQADKIITKVKGGRPIVISDSEIKFYETTQIDPEHGDYQENKEKARIKAVPGSFNLVFEVSGSSGYTNSVYISQSGKIGFNTDNPKNEFDIKANTFKVRTKDGKQETSIEAGRFSTKKYANAATSESIGSEINLSYTPGTFESPTKAQIGETIGTINWVDESYNTFVQDQPIDENDEHLTSGSIAQITSTVRRVTEAGAIGDFQVKLNVNPEEPTEALLPFITIDPYTHGQTVLFPYGITSTTNIIANSNISASGTITANSFVGAFTGGVTGDATGLTGTPSISVTNITASGNISASGTIIADHIKSFDAYAVELDPGSAGPRIHFGAVTDTDTFMSFGAYGGKNNINTTTRDFHLYGTNTTTGFYFDESAGKFGIGTTTPSEKLQVNGNIAISGSNATLQLREGSAELYKFTAGGTSLDMTVNGTDAISIFQAGQVGIGTTTPPEKLTVEGAISASGEVNIDSAAALFSSKLTISGDAYTTGGWKLGSGATYVGKAYNNSGIYSIEADTNRDIQFGDAGTPAVMYIDNSTEKVGIGTTSPSEKLTVEGDISASGDLHIKSDDIYLGNNETRIKSYSSYLGLFAAGGSAKDLKAKSLTLSNDFGDSAPTNGLFVKGDATIQGTLTAQEFHTEFVSASVIFESGSTKFGDTSDDIHQFSGSLRVTGSGDHYILGGNVGIGTTNPGVALEIGNISGGHIRLSDAYSLQWANANNRIYNQSNATIFVNNANESVRILGDGKVGIGTTTPTEKLQVEGNISSSGTGSFSDGRFTGKVGIGVTTPSEKLEVAGKIKFTGTGLVDSGGEELIFNSNDIIATSKHIQAGFGLWARAGSRSMGVDGSATYMGLYTNTTEKVRITTTGEVGIGTTAPAEKLTVVGDISASVDIHAQQNLYMGLRSDDKKLHLYNNQNLNYIYTSHSASVNNAQLTIQGANYTHAVNFKDSYSNQDNYATLSGGYTHDSKLILFNSSSQLTTTLSTATSSLNHLNVGGNINFTGTTANTLNSPVNLTLNADSDSNSGDAYRNIIFQNRGSENMRIAANGNVGIGTNNPQYAKLQVAGSVLFTSTLQVQGLLYLRGDTYHINHDSSGFVQTTDVVQGGSELFLDNNFVRSFNADNGGNIGIGTKSPTEALQVTGDISSSGDIHTQDKFVVRGSAGLLRIENPGWTTAGNHDILYNGWKSDTDDYVYLKAGGNSTSNHGVIAVTDTAGFLVGNTNDETGAVLDNNATFGLDRLDFRVDIGGNITASGNISASGTITANSFVGAFTGGVTGDATGLTGTPNISVGHITASGNISASGDLSIDNIHLDGAIVGPSNFVIYSSYSNRGRIDLFDSTSNNSTQVKLYGGTAALELQKNTGVEITGDITASGDISASGNLLSSGLTVDGGTGVGTTALVKILQSGNTSTDGISITSAHANSHRIYKDVNGGLNIGSSLNTNAFLQDLSGNISIEGNITSSGNISASGDLTATNLYVNDSIIHHGDSDTYIKFDTNRLRFYAGNKIVFDAHDNGSTFISSNNSTALTLNTSQKATFAGEVSIPDKITHVGDTNTWIGFDDGNDTFRAVVAGSEKFNINTSRTRISNNNLEVNGDVTVAGTITAQEFHTEFVSASIMFESGSTKFGDTQDDIHQMTGSLLLTGSQTVDGNFEVFKTGTGRTVGDLLVDHAGKYTTVGRLSSTSGDVSSFKVRDRLNRAYLDVNTATKYISFNPEIGDITMQIASGYGFKINTNQFIVSASGNVGIGTATPTEKLEIKGNLKISPTNGGNLQFRNNTTPVALLGSTYHINAGTKTDLNAYVYGNNPFSIWTNNNNRLTILGGGNVGIGTTAPQTLLHLESTEPVIRYDDTNSGLHYIVGQVGDKFVFDTNNSTYGEYTFDAPLTVTDRITATNVTASGNISASGTLLVGGVISGKSNIVSYGTLTSYGNQIGGGGGTFKYKGGGATSTIGHQFEHLTSNYHFAASSGDQTMMTIFPSISQSSTAGYTGLKINSTELRTGSGTKNLLDLQVNSTSSLVVSSTGNITSSGNISASGTVIGHLVPQVPKVEYYTITSSALREETTMTLPNSLTYMTSSGGYEYLEMFADGIRLNRTIDYAEVDTSTVRYLISLPSQSVITYKSLRTV